MSSSGQSILDADLFDRFTNTPERKVIVLWDYENCPVPKGVFGLSVIRNIREAALKFGSIDQFEAYCDWSGNAGTNIKNDLSISGVKLRDCPKKGWIGTVNKAIVVDMMVYALERPQTTTIILISGDRDHAYAISTLRNRGYPVKLVAPAGTLHPGLQIFADLLDWNAIFRSELPPTELVDYSRLVGGEEEETEEEEDETSEEEEDEEEAADADTEGDEGEMETEAVAQVQVGVEAETDETTQVQIGVETEMEETVQLEVEAEKKVQVLVETDDEAWDSGEPALPSPPTWSQTVPSSYVGGSSQPGFGASVVQHRAQDVPPKFLGLVQELEAIKASGSPPPNWSSLIPRVKQRQPSALSEAGVKKWPEYLDLAEKEGVVELQRRQPNRIGGMKVILRMVAPSYGGGSIQPKFGVSFIQQRQTVPPSFGGGSSQHGLGTSSIQQPWAVPPNYGGGSTQPGFGASFNQQRQSVPPSYGGGSNQPRIGASSIQQPQTASPSYGGRSSQPEFGASVVRHRARDVPPTFLVLVQELEAIKATGSPAPRWNELGKLVKQRLPSVVSDAGVNSWRRYLLLAEKEGIIEIMRQPNKGRNIGKSTISLSI